MSVKPFDINAYRKLLDGMRAQMPALIEYEVLKAKLAHERFRALTSAGFTETQALEIVKSWSV